MRNRAHDFRSYSFKSNDKVLVDANIWLYLFPAPMSSQASFAVQYSNGFSRMIREGAQPVLDPIILSEYLNRYCRIEWQGQYSTTYPDFKSFRNSSDYQEVAAAVSVFAKRIIGMCAVHSTPVSSLDIVQAIRDFESAMIDFNDALMADVCRKHDFKLLTNDSDFQSGGIEVLTTHPRLLQACSA